MHEGLLVNTEQHLRQVAVSTLPQSILPTTQQVFDSLAISGFPLALGWTNAHVAILELWFQYSMDDHSLQVRILHVPAKFVTKSLDTWRWNRRGMLVYEMV